MSRGFQLHQLLQRNERKSNNRIWFEYIHFSYYFVLSKENSDLSTTTPVFDAATRPKQKVKQCFPFLLLYLVTKRTIWWTFIYNRRAHRPILFEVDGRHHGRKTQLLCMLRFEVRPNRHLLPHPHQKQSPNRVFISLLCFFLCFFLSGSLCLS